MRDGSNSGLWILAVFSLLHVSTFIAWSIYQERRIDELQNVASRNQEKISEMTWIRQLLGDTIVSKTERTKRHAEADNGFIQTLLQNQRDHFVDVYLKEVEKQTLAIFRKYSEYLNPDDQKESVRYVRAGTTSNPTSGNEMAQIFEQLAQSEISIFNKYCNQSSTICLPGPKGDQGPKGETGLQGLKGDPGIQGNKGDVGANGAKGTKGDIGVIGLPGQKGVKGEMGPPGMYGPPGPKGPKGDMGVPGRIGYPGQKGDNGARGEPGPAGIPGLKGNKGDTGLTGSQGLKGETGIQGPRGAPGTLGEKGGIGAPGMQGQKGERGSPGLPGLNGVPGAQGIPGQKGERGETGRAAAIQSSCCDSLAKPFFNSSTETIKIIEGANVVLKCNPFGHPKPTITWSPDPSTLNSASVVKVGSNIEISNADVAQTGSYVCTAKSALGTATKTINLEVYKHIKIVDTIHNHTLLEGQNVVFECKFDGQPPPNITWYHMNTDGSLTQITTGIVAIPGGSQLELRGVSSANKGEYMCKADNGLESLSQHAYLTTQGPPTILPMPDVQGLVGSTMKLHCQAVGDPRPTTTWSAPPNVNNAYEDKNGDLVLMDLQPGDAGRYICKATNALGSTSSGVNLNVKAPGHVEIAGKINSVTSSTHTVGLDCTATGDPPLNVQWYHDGKPIVKDQNHLILPGNTLLIMNVKHPDDLGSYMCVASNQYGSDNKTAMVYDDKGTKTCSDPFSDCQYVCGAKCPPGCISVGYTGIHTYNPTEPICDSAIKSGAITSAKGGLVVWKNTGSTYTIVTT